MSISKAIVLAAGVGSRLRPFTADRPKCLVEVGGRSLIEHQLRALRACGVDDVVMVVGYGADRVRQELGGAVRYIENERYEATNSLYSLSLASDELSSGVLILNSDVLAVPILFDRLMRAPDPDAILVELGSNFEPEDMKVELRDSYVVNFGKNLPAANAHAHNVGVAKFSAIGAGRLIECLRRLVAAGRENDWAPAAYLEFARQWPLRAVATDGLPWVEIDFPEDLARARVDVEPAIAALEYAVVAP